MLWIYVTFSLSIFNVIFDQKLKINHILSECSLEMQYSISTHLGSIIPRTSCKFKHSFRGKVKTRQRTVWHIQVMRTFPTQSLGCFHVCDLLLQLPNEQSQRWAGPLAQFSALSECHSDDLELPLASVCKYVTIMIRIDDRTFWFHCLAKGTGEEISWIWTSVWFWHQKWYVRKVLLLFTSGFPKRCFSVWARSRGQREWPCQGREITDLKEKFSCSYPLGELC